jgi:hypothetical protein
MPVNFDTRSLLKQSTFDTLLLKPPVPLKEGKKNTVIKKKLPSYSQKIPNSVCGLIQVNLGMN